MDGQPLYAILSLAFGLGMLHALDADHIMAVSGLASTKPNFTQCLRFCAIWAVGHGLTLLVIGIAVFSLGFAIPQELSRISEHLVGVVLIMIGVWVLWDIYRQKTHFHYHQHDNLPRHAHWHRHDNNHLPSEHLQSHSTCDTNQCLGNKTDIIGAHMTTAKNSNEAHSSKVHRHEHGAVMVGVLHGLAGSAPLLAIIPLSQYSSPIYALLYLLIFALGVLVSMLIFGGIISGVFSSLLNRGDSIVLRLRIGISCSAVIMGGFLLYTGLSG